MVRFSDPWIMNAKTLGVRAAFFIDILGACKLTALQHNCLVALAGDVGTCSVLVA